MNYQFYENVKLNVRNQRIIYRNTDFEKVVNNSILLNIPFKNQSSVTLANEAFQIYTRGDKIYSTFNSEARSVFFDYMKGPFVFSNYVPLESAELLAVDISKCYSSCISTNNTEEWCIFSSFDEITEYKGKLIPGFYYAETDSFFPMKGTGWYSCAMLKYCKSIGIQFEIKYEITPSYTLPSNHFNELVDRIFKKCGSDNGKFMVNAMIGCWFKKASHSQKARYTAKLVDAITVGDVK